MPTLPKPTLLDGRVLLSDCLTGAPLSLITELSSSLDTLASLVIPAYPIPPPPQAQPLQETGSPSD